MLMVSKASSLGGAPAHAHTGRRRGGPCTRRARLVDLGHRPSSGARSQDGPHNLTGQRSPGVRRRAAPDPLEPFVAYLRARFLDDPHLWLSALFDEVTALGFPRSYPSFVRGVRRAGLRPHCERCRGVKGGRRSRSSSRRATSSSGTGSSAAGRRGAAQPTSCWAPCPTRAGCAASSPPRWTRPTWSRPSTPCCAAWAARPGPGGPTA